MMKGKMSLLGVIALVIVSFGATNAQAASAKAAGGLASVCPQIRQVAGDMFWKNNKPIRASSAFAAPVIGYNRVMTFAYQAGRGGPLLRPTGLYSSNGTKVASMFGQPCRSDHCGGRVVSNLLTASARRTLVATTKSPTGYVKLSSSLCIRIPDVGACYNAQKRGPCAGIVR